MADVRFLRDTFPLDFGGDLGRFPRQQGAGFHHSTDTLEVHTVVLAGTRCRLHAARLAPLGERLPGSECVPDQALLQCQIFHCHRHSSGMICRKDPLALRLSPSAYRTLPTVTPRGKDASSTGSLS
jgi:hypothetical protein